MSLAEIKATVDELYNSPAKNYDPISFAVIQSLAKKCLDVAPSNNAILEQTLKNHIDTYQEKFTSHNKKALALAKKFSSEFPQQANLAHSLFKQCQFKQLEQLYIQLNNARKTQSTLKKLRVLTDEINQSAEQSINQTSSLNQLLEQQTIEFDDNNEDHQTITQATKHRSLRSLEEYKTSKQHFYTDKVIEKAIDSEPENPGPHNPHMLAINALSQLRALSPQYSRRFANYVDTLLWLEKNASKLV